MRSRHLQALAGITVLGALLRFATLGDQSYWGDEGVTVALVRMSFGDKWSPSGRRGRRPST